MAIEKCSVIDNICHGRERHDSNFLFMYGCFFLDCHVRLSFDKFIGVLCVLNVTPTQLYPNSWGYLVFFNFV